MALDIGKRGIRPRSPRGRDKDAYVATVGGVRITETATDLAVALATWSSLHEQPLPAKTVVIGEVGLAGELRPVPNVERRLQEAARLGYKRAIVPRGEINPVDGMQVRQVATLGEALATVQP